MTPFLTAAARYAARGWAVFPLVPGAKTPLTEHGFKDGTTDAGIIAGWAARWPDANVGIVTGERSGIAVLDVDPKNGGAVSLGDLTVELGPLPATLTADTGGGGVHHVFRHVHGIGRVIGFRPGLDYLGDNGYAVGAPSIHPSGGVYRWRRDVLTIADAPAWLVAMVATKRGAKSTGFRAPPPPPSFPGTTYGRASLRRSCKALAAAPKGGRNTALNAAAYSLARLVAAGHLAAEDVRAHLLDAVTANGYADEAGEAAVFAVIESAMDAGQADGPRGPTLPWARRESACL